MPRTTLHCLLKVLGYARERLEHAAGSHSLPMVPLTENHGDEEEIDGFFIRVLEEAARADCPISGRVEYHEGSYRLYKVEDGGKREVGYQTFDTFVGPVKRGRRVQLPEGQNAEKTRLVANALGYVRSRCRFGLQQDCPISGRDEAMFRMIDEVLELRPQQFLVTCDDAQDDDELGRFHLRNTFHRDVGFHIFSEYLNWNAQRGDANG